MSLDLLKDMPTSTQAIHVEDLLKPRDSALVLEMPDPGFVEREIAYWIGVLDAGVFDGRPDLEGIGAAIYQILSDLNDSATRFARDMAYESEHFGDVTNMAHLMYTQQQMAAMLGLSQLLQVPEIADLLRGARPPWERKGEPDELSYALIDNDPGQYDHSGLHLDPYLMGVLKLVVPEPEQDQWYAGDTVCVRTHRPAHMSSKIEGMFKGSGATLADHLALTSLAGRVKIETWRGQTA